MIAGDNLIPCLPLLLQVFEEELLGGVADEKEVDKLAKKNKETRCVFVSAVQHE